MSADKLRRLVTGIEQLDKEIKASEDPNERERLSADRDVLVQALRIERDKLVREESGDTYSGLGSTAMGVIGGISLDFADEIGGGLMSLFGDGTYTDYRDQLRAEFEQARADNPKSYMAGEIGSAFVPGLNVASAAARAGKLGQKIYDGNKWVSAATTGATESALSQVGGSNEEGLDSVGLGTVGAGLAGAGLGPAIQGVGTVGIKALDGLITSAQSKANRGVRNALNADGINTAGQLRGVGGPDSIVADAGPNTRSLARQQGNRQGEGKAQLERVLRERNDAAPQRVQDSLDRNTSGTGTTAEQKLSAVEEAAKAEATPLYKEAYKQDLTPEQVKELAPILNRPMGQRALEQAKEMMDNNLDPLMGSDPDGAGATTRLLHYTLMSLQDMANKAKKADGSDAVYAQAVAMKNAVRDIMVRGNPKFAEAQKIWADKSSFGRAIEDGQAALGANRRAADITGEYRSLPKAEQGAYEIGLSDQLALRLERLGDTTTGQKLGASNKIVKNDGEREVIREIFGRDGLLIKDLENEALYKQTYNEALSGSRTAADMADMAEGVLPSKEDFVRGTLNRVFEALSSRFRDESRRKSLDMLSKRINRMNAEEIKSLITGGRMDKIVSNAIRIGKNGKSAGRLADTAIKEMGLMEALQ